MVQYGRNIGSDDTLGCPQRVGRACLRRELVLPRTYEELEQMVRNEWIRRCVVADEVAVRGVPMNRQNELVNGNQSLRDVWNAFRGREGQRVVVLADFAWSGCRVSRIHFYAPLRESPPPPPRRVPPIPERGRRHLNALGRALAASYSLPDLPRPADESGAADIQNQLLGFRDAMLALMLGDFAGLRRYIQRYGRRHAQLNDPTIVGITRAQEAWNQLDESTRRWIVSNRDAEYSLNLQFSNGDRVPMDLELGEALNATVDDWYCRRMRKMLGGGPFHSHPCTDLDDLYRTRGESGYSSPRWLRPNPP